MEIKTSIYFKQCAKYINKPTASPSYHKFSSDGKITTISTVKQTISSPTSLSIQKGFEIISKDEFDKIFSEIIDKIC
jgi:hypothetical protein